MKARHALIVGNALCGLIAFAALGGFQVAHASTYAVERQARIWESFQGVFDRPNSVVLDLKYPRSGSPLPTSRPAGSTPVGNMGAIQAGTGVRVVGNVAVPLGNTGKVAAASAGAAVSRAAFVRGIGLAAANPLVGIGLAIAAPSVIEWLDSGGVKINPDQSGGFPFLKADGETCESNCREYRYNTKMGWSPTVYSACTAAVSYQAAKNLAVNPNGVVPVGVVSVDVGRVRCVVSNSNGSTSEYQFSYRSSSGPYVGWLPASMDDIAQYMDRPEAPALTPSVFAEGVTKAGIDPFGASPPAVSVSGPGSVPGQTTQSTSQTNVIPGTTTQTGPGYSGQTQPATSTTTQTVTHNVTYNDNRVTYNTTNNTVTTITNNVTGQTDAATAEETTEEDGETECQKNPESLACADLDTPDGEIPKATASVTYQVEDTFGSGACPADVYGTINGQSIKLYDYAQTCSYVSMYVRPMLLVLCALGALFIVMPGKADS